MHNTLYLIDIYNHIYINLYMVNRGVCSPRAIYYISSVNMDIRLCIP